MNESKYYNFFASGLEDNTFTVAKFTGSEAISSLFQFRILLIAQRQLSREEIDGIVNNPARLVFLGRDTERNIHGIVSKFEYLQHKQQQQQYYFFYRATLSPQAWRMTLNHSSKIFLDKTTPAIIEEVLSDAGLKKGEAHDFQVDIRAESEPWEFVCMFNESPFDFISQRMERNGAYYFFEQKEAGELLRIVDKNDTHITGESSKTLPFATSLPQSQRATLETIQNLHLQQNALPQKVKIRDYNYSKSALNISAEAAVDPNGVGEVYCYGEHARSLEEARTLATLRKEELLCGKRVYSGISNAWSMYPGDAFHLAGHPYSDFNSEYLITEVQHQGQQMGYLHSILGLTLGNDKNAPVYSNTFSCIESHTQYRPPRKTEKRRFHGLVSAIVDGEGSSGLAHLDEHGRYKVILQFDDSGRDNGGASCWLRLMHPYAGRDVGFHFPLLKGTEVMVSFMDGDPDRPIITGAVHNSESPSIVTSKNKSYNAIQTASGQVFWICDKVGDQHILMGTTESESQFKLEAPSSSNPAGPQTKGDDSKDDKSDKNDSKDDSSKSEPQFPSKTAYAGHEYKFYLGNSAKMTLGNKLEAFVGTKTSMTLAPEYKLAFGPKYDVRLNFSKSLRQKFYAMNKFGALGLAFTPLNVKYNNNDSFEWGTGSTFNAKASKTSLGQEKSTMFGGAHASVDTLLNTAATTVKRCMTLAVIVSSGLALAQALTVKQKRTGWISDTDKGTGNLEFIAYSALPTTLASMRMNRVLSQIHVNAKNLIEKKHAIGGMVKCDASGVTINANSQVGLDSAKISIATRKVTAGTGAIMDQAGIDIDKDGKSIVLSRGLATQPKRCSMEMRADTIIMESTTAASSCSLSQSGSLFQIITGKAAPSILKTSEKLNALNLGVDNKITQDTTGISLKKTNSEVKLAATEVEIKCATSKFKLTPATTEVAAKATLSLNGTIVNLG